MDRWHFRTGYVPVPTSDTVPDAADGDKRRPSQQVADEPDEVPVRDFTVFSELAAANYADEGLTLPNFCGGVLYGVIDGHGAKGRDVAHFVKRILPECFSKSMQLNNNDVWLAFSKTFDYIQIALTHSNIDASSSGCAIVVVFEKNNILYVANAGDSEALLVFPEVQNETKHQGVKLTQKHRPSQTAERYRIESTGGEIRQKRVNGEEQGPLRVFMKGLNVPGLSLTRALGDIGFDKIGITHSPHIDQRKLTGEETHLILASDGLWDVVSKRSIAKILAKGIDKSPEESCKDLIRYAIEKRRRQQAVLEDDVVMVVVKLREKTGMRKVPSQLTVNMEGIDVNVPDPDLVDLVPEVERDLEAALNPPLQPGRGGCGPGKEQCQVS